MHPFLNFNSTNNWILRKTTNIGCFHFFFFFKIFNQQTITLKKVIERQWYVRHVVIFYIYVCIHIPFFFPILKTSENTSKNTDTTTFVSNWRNRRSKNKFLSFFFFSPRFINFFTISFFLSLQKNPDIGLFAHRFEVLHSFFRAHVQLLPLYCVTQGLTLTFDNDVEYRSKEINLHLMGL